MLFQRVIKTIGYYLRHGCVGREMGRFVTSVISPSQPLRDHHTPWQKNALAGTKANRLLV
jgi:hypothetical protein